MANTSYAYNGTTFNGDDQRKREIIKMVGDTADDYINDGIGSNEGKLMFYLLLDGRFEQPLNAPGEVVDGMDLPYLARSMCLPIAVVSWLHENLNWMRTSTLSNYSLRERQIYLQHMLQAIPVGMMGEAEETQLLGMLRMMSAMVMSTIKEVDRYRDSIHANRRALGNNHTN